MKFLSAASAVLVAYCLAVELFPAHVSADLTATDWANA